VAFAFAGLGNRPLGAGALGGGIWGCVAVRVVVQMGVWDAPLTWIAPLLLPPLPHCRRVCCLHAGAANCCQHQA